jgi:hypothetical protein
MASDRFAPAKLVPDKLALEMFASAMCIMRELIAVDEVK